MARERGARPSVEDIARANPKVDLQKLQEARAQIQELRARGVPPPAHSVRSPYGQRLARHVRDEDGETG